MNPHYKQQAVAHYKQQAVARCRTINDSDLSPATKRVIAELRKALAIDPALNAVAIIGELLDCINDNKGSETYELACYLTDIVDDCAAEVIGNYYAPAPEDDSRNEYQPEGN